MLQNLATGLFENAPEAFKEIYPAFEGLRDELRVPGDRVRFDEFAPVRRNKRDVRTEAMQPRLGVQDFLNVGSMRCLIDDGQNAFLNHCAGNRTAHILHCQVSQNGDALRRSNIAREPSGFIADTENVCQ